MSEKSTNRTDAGGNELHPLLGTVINPLYVVRLNEQSGYKGSSYYFNTRASSENEAIDIMRKQRKKFMDIDKKYFSAYIPKNEDRYIEGDLIYFEGDPRL